MRTWRNEEQIVGWGVLQSLISPSKGNEKKNEVINALDIRSWSPIQVRIPQNKAQLC